MTHFFDNPLYDFIFFYIYSIPICVVCMLATRHVLESKLRLIPLILLNTLTYCVLTWLTLLIPFSDLWLNSSARLVAGPANYILYVCFMFKGTRQEKLFTLLLVNISSYVLAGIWSLWAFLFSEQYNRFFSNIAVYTVYFSAFLPCAGGLIFLLLIKQLNMKSFRSIGHEDKNHFLFMSAFSVIYMMILPNLIMLMDVPNDRQRVFLAVNSAVGLSVGVFSYVFIYRMYRKIQAVFIIENEKASAERRHELSVLKARQSGEHRAEADRLTTDILEVLDNTLLYIGQNDISAAIALLSGGAAQLQALKRPVTTGNRITDYFIYKTQDACDKLNIRFSFECAPVSPEKIDEFDFCTIISNILDNAVYACENVSHERFICLKIHENDNILFISCKNSKETSSRVRPRDGFHGYGLQNVRDCAGKYGGDVQIEDSDEVFGIQILLYV